MQALTAPTGPTASSPEDRVRAATAAHSTPRRPIMTPTIRTALAAAGLLALAVLALAALQVGVMPITVPVVIWAWFARDPGQAILLTAWLTVGTFIDLVLKPIMLGSSLGTPRLVIFAGVMMGAISYGPIGLFIGPVLLAVVWDVLRTGLDGPEVRPKGVTREPAGWNR
ncbi:hypothetical protein CNY89_03820 [Amaricoccus sp. HAR-UPW-R2A-40]|nr:hypothetical protein CNY89_03820 [Amaricoccus sp. HAR-UPW-R2A-40]